MTTTFTFTAAPDANGAVTIQWGQSKLDAFGQFPALIITVDRKPTQDFGFTEHMPLTAPCNLVLYGLQEGNKINITAIKG